MIQTYFTSPHLTPALIYCLRRPHFFLFIGQFRWYSEWRRLNYRRIRRPLSSLFRRPHPEPLVLSSSPITWVSEHLIHPIIQLHISLVLSIQTAINPPLPIPNFNGESFHHYPPTLPSPRTSNRSPAPSLDNITRQVRDSSLSTHLDRPYHDFTSPPPPSPHLTRLSTLLSTL